MNATFVSSALRLSASGLGLRSLELRGRTIALGAPLPATWLIRHRVRSCLSSERVAEDLLKGRPRQEEFAFELLDEVRRTTQVRAKLACVGLMAFNERPDGQTADRCVRVGIV